MPCTLKRWINNKAPYTVDKVWTVCRNGTVGVHAWYSLSLLKQGTAFVFPVRKVPQRMQARPLSVAVHPLPYDWYLSMKQTLWTEESVCVANSAWNQNITVNVLSTGHSLWWSFSWKDQAAPSWKPFPRVSFIDIVGRKSVNNFIYNAPAELEPGSPQLLSSI